MGFLQDPRLFRGTCRAVAILAPASGLPAQKALNLDAIKNRLEDEADSVADQSLGMPDPGASVASATPRISRKLWSRLPPISPSGITLRRDDKTDPPELRALDRPGAKWPFGPVTQHKSTQHDLYDYILAVKHVESAYGADKQSVLQRLRRLYYSSFSGKGEYEQVIAEQPGAGGSSDPPLDARMIGTTAIDFLYETNVLKLPDNELIDVSHVLAALDVKLSGLTFKAEAAEPAIGIRWLGVVTWAGDLASWMANYIQRDRASPEGPPPPADPAPQKVDLISDMDAQILAEENVKARFVDIPPGIGAERHPARWYFAGRRCHCRLRRLAAAAHRRRRPLAARP